VTRALLYCLAYIYPILVLASSRGGWFLLSVPVLTFVLIPTFDFLAGLDPFNPGDDNEEILRKGLSFRLITWFWVPVQLLLTGYGLWWVIQSGRSYDEMAGMAVAVGLTNGVVGITFAHELLHKANRFEQFLSEVLMTTVSYPHFCIEHIFGHHKNVGTPKDAASARFGESFYQFFPRTVIGGYLSAWHIEFNRLTKQGKGTISWRNKMIRYHLALLFLYTAVLLTTGVIGICFFVIQSFIAFSSLEIINYLEHYGLARKEIAPGQYEKTAPMHSWNSGHRISNWFLINLARHSDHHFIASKRYQVLRTYQNESPQLPYGYGTMYLATLVPPLWFYLVNPLVLKWRDKGDSTYPSQT
jgi:alkane 1-monooxygenase